MSKLAVLALIAALLAVGAQATYDAICTSKDNSRKCSSSASLRVFVRGRGRCVGSGNAYCSAWTASSKDCVDVDQIYVGGACRKVKVSADARCWAVAAAQAATKASAGIICEGGKAVGCVKAKADAEAIACSLAAAIVDIKVKLGHNEAECDAKIVAIIEAIAKATAESQAKACSANGKPGFDYDADFALAIEKVAADAFATCIVYCDGYGNSSSSVSGGGGGDVVKSFEKEIGDGADAQTGPGGR